MKRSYRLWHERASLIFAQENGTVAGPYRRWGSTVETAEKIDAFIKVAGAMLERAGCGDMITEERAHIVHYTSGR